MQQLQQENWEHLSLGMREILRRYMGLQERMLRVIGVWRGKWGVGLRWRGMSRKMMFGGMNFIGLRGLNIWGCGRRRRGNDLME